MGQLPSLFESINGTTRKPFDVEEIINTLKSEPLNIEEDKIEVNDDVVMVSIPLTEYVKNRVGMIITHSFYSNVICDTNNITFTKVGGYPRSVNTIK